MRRTIEHFADRNRQDQAVVTAAAERRVEEEVPGFSKPASAPGVASLKVVGFRPLLPQHRIGDEQSGRSHVDHRLGVLCDP
jgi:hypothetical protein